MTAGYDVIVIGLGAMGGSAAFHLARRGLKVGGFDRHNPPHRLGSSHGETRIIREAYFEHPAYVPLIQRAYELWSELERLSGKKLFEPVGGLMIGPPDGVLVRGAKESARLHRLPYDYLSAGELHERLPVFLPDSAMVGVWEKRAGFLYPERCVEAHLALAKAAGADIHVDEGIQAWKAGASGVEVKTVHGTYWAEQAVISAGPWVAHLVPELAGEFQVERQVLFWFAPKTNSEFFSPRRCPIFICEYQPGRFFYGFPDAGKGVKVALYHEGRPVDPDQVEREVANEEQAAMRTLVQRYLPDAAGELSAAEVCLFTNTADGHFWIDRHENERVLVASPCSGHGFKFSSVIGEILAGELAGETSPFDLSLFRRRTG